MGLVLLYRSRGIAFREMRRYVVAIVVFSPGTDPDFQGMIY